MSAVAATIGRPPLSLLGTEPLRAMKEFLTLKFWKTKLHSEGDGHPVVIFPGLGSDGRAFSAMREQCARWGYQPIDWGRGVNQGPQGELDDWFADLTAHTERLLEPFPKSATFIGHSLGGFYAREIAKKLGRRVRQVITIGTPFNADGDHTHVGWLYKWLNGRPNPLCPELAARFSKPPRMPTTSIYSRNDGIVAWQACMHVEPRSRIEDIEIESSHLGMAWNPTVLEILHDRLAQRPGRWKPYRSASPESARTTSSRVVLQGA